jgi:hypothetical protein
VAGPGGSCAGAVTSRGGREGECSGCWACPRGVAMMAGGRGGKGEGACMWNREESDVTEKWKENMIAGERGVWEKCQ